MKKASPPDHNDRAAIADYQPPVCSPAGLAVEGAPLYRGCRIWGRLPVNEEKNELRDNLPREVPDKDKVLLLHCQSGMRSLNGMRQLQRLGYKRIFNLGSLTRARQIVNASPKH